MDRDVFSGYHPIVSMLFFVLVFGFAMFLNHPVCLGISLICALVYSIYLRGKKAVRFNLVFMLPLLLMTMLINPLFSHQGVTILAYLPDGNPLTLESIVYGVFAAFLLITVIGWFFCFNAVMTSDKFVYLFGRIIPALSLVLSMSLRFVPRFVAQIKVTSNAQKCVGRDVSNGGIIKRAKHGIKILSVMVTWALENAIETADSMKSRGYGLSGRTAFSIYRFDKRDKKALLFLLICGSIVFVGVMLGKLKFVYMPIMFGAEFDVWQAGLFILYFTLCAMPIIMNVKGDLEWRAINKTQIPVSSLKI
ncbi:MAG: energy-coupling factor transporter transmembrane protein EcfT [Candidatus Bathyarchaeota archaeon]|uniref:energy-coupling factor transporter transmembrane component T n=1 Tax=Candidatus Bathycorpusculum sp. TaxID=2994959 RepID=UPI0028214CD9|nr:energy-coupling factor transporter transmembrane protein EcfT [Candidatus Termiticorpusculum sp.]MCL2292480.1 energy-coupling factor transporter transmembrane protein EcfT [Candidatus Termiticorpusculum sp.]